MKKLFLFLGIFLINIGMFAQSTFLFKDINTSGSSNANSFVEYNSKLYFAAQSDDTANNTKLWVYDGTNEPSEVTNSPTQVGELAVCNGKLYFHAYDATYGTELWEYNGTDDPERKTDINTTGDATPANLFALGTTLYFKANGTNEDGDVFYGDEVYKYDGGPSATLIHDINTGSGGSLSNSSDAYNFTVCDGNLYFITGDNMGYPQKIYKYTGSGEPTIIKESTYLKELVVLGTDLYFVARNGNSDPVANQESLYKYTGSGSPTALTGSDLLYVDEPTVFNGEIYFSAMTDAYEVKLHKYNGSTVSQVGTTDVCYTQPSFKMDVFDGKLFLGATNGSDGYEYFECTTAGSFSMIKDINTSGDAFNYHLHNGNTYDTKSGTRIVTTWGEIFFIANDGTNGQQLWRYDGTDAKKLDNVGSEPWYVENGNYCTEYDHDFTSWNEDITQLFEFDGRVFFQGNDGTNGKEIWAYYPTTTYDGSAWSDGLPTVKKNAVIDGDITITSDLNVNYLTINAGKTLTVNSGITLNTKRNLINNGTITNNGTIVSENASFTTEAFNGTFLNSATVNNNGSITTEENFENTGTVNNYSKITTNGSLENTGTFTSKSSASGTGSLIVNGTSTGDFNIESYFSDGVWHYMSPPVSGATTEAFDIVYAKEFNTTNYEWVYLSQGDNLSVGKGYAIWRTAETEDIATFTGTLTTNDFSPSIVKVTGIDTSLNFIGNPFSCAINGNIHTWTKTNVNNTIKIWDGAQYLDWNGSAGTITGGIIPTSQSFFIIVTGDTPSITIPASDRTHNTAKIYKNNEILPNLLTLKVEGGGYEYIDQTFMNFKENATDDFDGEFDVKKWFGIDLAPQLYSVIYEGMNLSINTMQNLESERIVNLAFHVENSGIYKITANGLESFTTDHFIYLEDLAMNEMINLSENPIYEFSYQQGEDINRFRVHFLDEQYVEMENINKEENPYFIYSNKNKIFIRNKSNNLNENIKLEVYSILGIKIFSENLENSKMSNFELNVENGNYIVKITDSKNSYSKKVFLKK